MVTAFVSHQCGLGSHPSTNALWVCCRVCCWVSHMFHDNLVPRVLSYPLSRSVGMDRRGPWERGWFPEKFTSGTPVFQIPVRPGMASKEWLCDSVTSKSSLYLLPRRVCLAYCISCYIDKIKLFRSALLKIAKCANKWKNTKPKCRSFLRFKNSLFLNEAECNTFCYFFFTICKVYNVQVTALQWTVEIVK